MGALPGGDGAREGVQQRTHAALRTFEDGAAGTSSTAFELIEIKRREILLVQGLNSKRRPLAGGEAPTKRPSEEQGEEHLVERHDEVPCEAVAEVGGMTLEERDNAIGDDIAALGVRNESATPRDVQSDAELTSRGELGEVHGLRRAGTMRVSLSARGKE